MLPSFMKAREYTRKRYPVTDDHGTARVDYTATPTTATFWGSVQPASNGKAETINRNGAEVIKTIFSPPGADVHHADLIDLSDGTYWVNGEPDIWEVGILDHVVIGLSRWIG